MAMERSNENPPVGYPVPDQKLAGPGGRFLRPERNPRFVYNVAPGSPPFHFHERPLTSHPLPIYRDSLLPDQRRRYFHNNNHSTSNASVTTTSTTTTSSSSSSFRKTALFCVCYNIVLNFILFMFGIFVLVFYILGPYSPTFSVEKITLQNPIFYDSPTRFSSLFNITMKVNNPSSHVGIFYEYDNSIVATYSGVRFCSGGIPPFFQAPKKKLLLQSPLTGLGVVLPDHLNQKLKNHTQNHWIPLTLNIMGMIRFKMSSITTRAFLKVSCEIVLDNLSTYNPQLISSSCDSNAAFWFPILN